MLNTDNFVRVLFRTASIGAVFHCILLNATPTAMAQCDGWSPMSVQGMNDVVNAVTVFRGEVIAAGAFTMAGGQAANRIARWDGSSWQPLSGGLNGPVFAMVVFNDALIVGGNFTQADGITVNRIAQWDGLKWHAMGAGMNDAVLALGEFNGVLYAGGAFTTADGNAASRIVRWNNSTWLPLGAGTNGSVYSIGNYSGDLVAGGAFASAGGVAAGNIARWNTQTAMWKAMGSGVGSPGNTIVQTMVIYDGVLVVGASNGVISRWNATDWQDISASGANNSVNCLAVYEGQLVASGRFTSIGGNGGARMARWDNSNWSPLGSGMNDEVSALVEFNRRLVAVGKFTMAGGATAMRVAIRGSADIAPAPLGNGSVDVGDLLAVINNWGSCGNPCPPFCPADISGDCQVNVTDLLAVINAWNLCPAVEGACWLPDNSCMESTYAQCAAASGLGWVANATCFDFDSDRIPSAFELDAPLAKPPFPFSPSSPFEEDTDGDKMKDGDEFMGTTDGLNLPALGANPCHQDAFIECDWVTDDDSSDANKNKHKPNANQISRMVNAFAAAPIMNPDGVMGITVHFDVGQEPYNGGNYAGKWPNISTDAGLGGDFLKIKNGDASAMPPLPRNFAANRLGYFYYCVSGNKFNNSASSGMAEIGGNDFVCAWGGFVFAGFNNKGSSDHMLVGQTIMHEFGHCLGLYHGGNDSANYKPNYNSIMNYRYQFVGKDNNNDALGNGIIGFSAGNLITLKECELDESKGIDGSHAIDWNKNGMIDMATVKRNLNCDCDDGTLHTEDCNGPAACVGAGAPDAKCTHDDCEELRDFNDWTHIVFTGVNDADFTSREVITCWVPWYMVPRK